MSLAAINKVRALKKEKARRKKKKQKSIDLTKYKDNPIQFATGILQVKYLTEEQKQILLSVRDRPTTNVQASHSVGKSFSMAVIVLWYVFAVEGQVFTTAPTLQQVKDILWKEIRRLYDKHKSKLGGSRGELFVKKSESAKAIGYTSRHTDASAFQGKHAVNLLLIQDEADGVSNIIDEAFESCLTGSENRGVRIGNPLTVGSAFHKACQLDKIKISVWSHPNVSWGYIEVEDNGKLIHRLKPEIAKRILKPEAERKDNPVLPQSEWDKDLPRDMIPGAVSIAWIEKVRVKYGEHSVYWDTRVEAEFPSDSIDGIIPISWLQEARDRYDRDPDYWDDKALQDIWRIGVDVGDGGDRHAVACWRGCVLYKVTTYPTQGDREDTIRLATQIVEPLINQLGADYAIAVDRLGVGAGTLGTLIRDGYTSYGCAFGETAKAKNQFKNRKTELYWGLREALRLGEIAIAPLGDIETEVFEDLTSVRYSLNTEKQIYCEPKIKTKAKLGRSPDAGDSVIIANEIAYNSLSEEIVTIDSDGDVEERELLALQREKDEFGILDKLMNG